MRLMSQPEVSGVLRMGEEPFLPCGRGGKGGGGGPLHEVGGGFENVIQPGTELSQREVDLPGIR